LHSQFEFQIFDMLLGFETTAPQRPHSGQISSRSVSHGGVTTSYWFL